MSLQRPLLKKLNLSKEELHDKSECLKEAISSMAPAEEIKNLIRDFMWSILVLRDQASGQQYSDIIQKGKAVYRGKIICLMRFH